MCMMVFKKIYYTSLKSLHDMTCLPTHVKQKAHNIISYNVRHIFLRTEFGAICSSILNDSL